MPHINEHSPLLPIWVGVPQPRLSGATVFNLSFVTRVVLAHERRLHTENWRREIKTPPKSGRIMAKTNNHSVFPKEVNPFLSPSA